MPVVSESQNPARLEVRLPPHLKRSVEVAAKSRGMSVSSFVNAALCDAIVESTLADQVIHRRLIDLGERSTAAIQASIAADEEPTADLRREARAFLANYQP